MMIDRNRLAAQLHRQSLLERAVSQTRVAIWATDLDGEVVLSEGGLLSYIGLEPGQAVGTNVYAWPSYPLWRTAKDRLLDGDTEIIYLTHPEATGDVVDLEGNHIRLKNVGVWVESYSALLSPAGRVVGILVSAMSLHGAEPTKSFSFCPLGACVIDQG